MSTRGDVDLDATEGSPGELSGDTRSPGGVASSVGAQLGDRTSDQDEPIVEGIGGERFDQPLVKFGLLVNAVAKAEVDVLGEAGLVAETDLQRHSPFSTHRPGSACASRATMRSNTTRRRNLSSEIPVSRDRLFNRCSRAMRSASAVS